MSKYNRYIDENKMNESKAKTIDFVMNEINVSARRKFGLSFPKFALTLTVLVIVAISILVLNPFGSNVPIPDPKPIVLTKFETEKLAELSYISGRLIAANLSLDKDLFYSQLSNPYVQSSLTMLDIDDPTEFETNINEFNTYFDMLKIFLEEDTFRNAITITSITESDYDTQIEFFVDGKLYTFLVIVIDEEITGELTINSQVFDVVGTYEETDKELKLELTASSGSDYIKIKYQTESEDEIEKKYEIEQNIGGVLKVKEIEVTLEIGEETVEITENNDSYKLKKEMEDTTVIYRLTYKIDEQEGEAAIYETIDINGATVYSYQITEGDKYKEVELNDPDEDEEENEQEDEENEDDENDEVDGDNEDQSNPYFEKNKINTL